MEDQIKTGTSPATVRNFEREKNDQRALYMRNELSHQQYYEWLARRIGLTPDLVGCWIGKDRIMRSKDQAFNDIPLQKWDDQHGMVLSFARSCSGGKFSWSLSDTVSCLKAMARVLRGPLLGEGEQYKR